MINSTRVIWRTSILFNQCFWILEFDGGARHTATLATVIAALKSVWIKLIMCAWPQSKSLNRCLMSPFFLNLLSQRLFLNFIADYRFIIWICWLGTYHIGFMPQTIFEHDVPDLLLSLSQRCFDEVFGYFGNFFKFHSITNSINIYPHLWCLIIHIYIKVN